MAELNDRGLDTDSLVRYGLLREVLAPVLGTLLATHLLDENEVGLIADRSGIDVAAWQRTFRVSPRKVEAPAGLSKDSANMQATIKQLVVGAVTDISNRIGPATAWILTANIDDVLALRSPTADDLERLSGWRPIAEAEVFSEYRWLVERLSTTFLGQWDTMSLHLEYRWLQGMATPPCPIEIMNARPSLGTELLAEIARRAVFEQPQDGMRGRLTAQVQGHALAFLEEGRAREAAALFEFVCREEPNNAEALNNLGFCLIPESPRDALQHLENANRLGYTPLVINVYNRMCCHMALGRFRAAVREAERYWEEPPEGRPVGATLWVPDDDGVWVLTGVNDARHALAQLSARAVQHIEARAQLVDSLVEMDDAEAADDAQTDEPEASTEA